MPKVYRSALLAAVAVLGLASSIERADAASNCSLPGLISCEILHSIFGSAAWQSVRPQMDTRQGTKNLHPSVPRDPPARAPRPVAPVSRPASAASDIVAPAPITVSDSMVANDRVAVVFRPPDPPTAGSGWDPLASLSRGCLALRVWHRSSSLKLPTSEAAGCNKNAPVNFDGWRGRIVHGMVS
jgi:hypothetical protein